MAELKPIYLIHGEDEVKLDDWRGRIRDRATREAASLELMDAARDSGEAVAIALSSMTLSMGTRYVVVDGIERWKDKDVTQVAEVLGTAVPDAVVLLVGTVRREPGRKPWAVPDKLAKAVQKAGGEVAEQKKPKLSQLAAWSAQRGSELGLKVDRDAGQVLVDRIGNDQRRLMRELEKIACWAPDGGHVNVDVVEELTAPDVEAKTYELADAFIDGNTERTMALADDLQSRGTDIMQILYALLRQLRDMRRAWAVLENGGTVQQAAQVIGGPQWKAKGVAARAEHASGERLERIAGALADLDYAVRGGGNVDTQTALILTLAA